MNASGAPDDHVIVLFGATGDLARRKLLPGLFHLASAGLLPPGTGSSAGRPPGSRSVTTSSAATRGMLLPSSGSKPVGRAWRAFERFLSFGTADPDDPKPLLSANPKQPADLFRGAALDRAQCDRVSLPRWQRLDRMPGQARQLAQDGPRGRCHGLRPTARGSDPAQPRAAPQPTCLAHGPRSRRRARFAPRAWPWSS